MSLFTLALSAAQAAPLVLRIYDPAQLITAPVQVELRSVSAGVKVPLQDEGGVPDVRSGDGIYSALIDPLPRGIKLTVTVTDSGGGVWTTQTRRSEDQSPTLELELLSDGSMAPPTAQDRNSFVLIGQKPEPPETRWGWVLAGALSCLLGLGLFFRSRRG